MKRSVGALACAAVWSCACGGSEEPYEVTIYGEEFIEDQIASDDVADGWTIEFDAFLIAVSEIEAGGASADGAYVFDLTDASGGSGFEVTSFDAPPEIGEVSYRIGPVSDAEPGNVEAAERDRLLDAEAAILVSGTAIRDDVTKTFAWAFQTDTRYGPCEVDAAARAAEITIHSDHLFYDDLEAPEPDLRFDLFAQADDDGDGDGVVTAEELEAVDISTLANYQVGSRDIDNLWDFVVEQSRTVGHIDGEGHCATD